MKQVKTIVITLGTAWVYQIAGTDQVVSNCHKLPDKYFDRRRLSVDEIVSQLGSILQYIYTLRQGNIRVVISVSPIRHLKDGFQENQLSKSTLIVAAHQLCEHLPFVEYFPAYEIMMDDLRDYRFYANDMCHPSELAIDYIWEKFEATYLSDKEQALRRRIDKLRKSLAHRPFNENSAAHHHHLERVLNAMTDIEKEYKGKVDFQPEKKNIYATLKKIESIDSQ